MRIGTDPSAAHQQNPACGYAPVIPPAEMARNPAVSREILRHALGWLHHHSASLPPDEQRELGKKVGIASGLYAAEFPAEYGGWSLPEVYAGELREEAAASGLLFSRHILSVHDGPTRLLLEGTPEQRECWLRPLVEGRWTRCLAMTEEQGGSDLSALRTTATWTDGRWVLSGRKYMISNAAHADMAIVLANAVGRGRGGPTFFAFTTDASGWKILRRLPGMDEQYHQYEIELDSVVLSEAAVLGGPGKIGSATGMATQWLPYGRVNIAARSVGLSRWALGVARQHAAERVIGSGKLSDKQYIREFIVRSHVKIEAARLLVRQAAMALDKGEIGVRQAAVAKLYATESACEVIDDAMQTLGGRGWLREFGLEQAYREARVSRMVDGASELLKETVFHLLP
ncbi:acyl-CoA dehydrogenase family protein [Streptomyces sp. NPDC059853]|uniref:acyl-CoA dehydrogenase family protein n=1 Tax=Streptomyces sp. NPDC059853 TaxID=3346973 RepID=UPI00364A5C11